MVVSTECTSSIGMVMFNDLRSLHRHTIEPRFPRESSRHSRMSRPAPCLATCRLPASVSLQVLNFGTLWTCYQQSDNAFFVLVIGCKIEEWFRRRPAQLLYTWHETPIMASRSQCTRSLTPKFSLSTPVCLRMPLQVVIYLSYVCFPVLRSQQHLAKSAPTEFLL